jgi:hypothetical protein
MPTARELLEQAEALMRRDRMAALASEEDFPLLTDAVPDAAVDEVAPIVVDIALPAAATHADAGVGFGAPLPETTPQQTAQQGATQQGATQHEETRQEAAQQAAAPPQASSSSADAAVARLVSDHVEVTQDQQGEPSIWVVPADEPATITETGPDSLWPVNEPRGDATASPNGDLRDREEGSDDVFEITENRDSVAVATGEASLVERSEAIAAPVEDFPLEATLDATRWNLMAEDIRMQVLQRIDIFTDTGLREQLNRRLQPVVDRASADLVAAINQHVGQILREYVAEAIEREIEKWRQEPR